MDYLATPSGAGPWPGVVMVHELFGLNDDIRGKTDRLADTGYLALAVDLFDRRSPIRCLVTAFRQLSAGKGPIVEIIDAGRRGLAERDDCTGKVGVIGFCMGGGFALVAAARGFDAAAINYGFLPKDLEGTLRGACPIVGSYGGADFSLRGVAARLDKTLTGLAVPHEIKEYPGASHAFMTETKPPLPLGALMRVSFDPAATADSWRRIDDFFDAHLRG